MTEPSDTSPDAAKQSGAVDETAPDPAAAAGESAPDSQPDDDDDELAASAEQGLAADLQEEHGAPVLADGVDVDVAPESPEVGTPATSDEEQMRPDPTGLGGVGGEGGAG